MSNCEFKFLLELLPLHRSGRSWMRLDPHSQIGEEQRGSVHKRLATRTVEIAIVGSCIRQRDAFLQIDHPLGWDPTQLHPNIYPKARTQQIVSNVSNGRCPIWILFCSDLMSCFLCAILWVKIWIHRIDGILWMASELSINWSGCPMSTTSRLLEAVPT